MMMAKPKWILAFLCVTVNQLVEALPALHFALKLQVGQNILLDCNLTNGISETTWYRLQIDQLLPIITQTQSNLGDVTTNHHNVDEGRFNIINNSGLEILQVQEADTGLYFCSAPYEGIRCFNRGVRLTVGDVWAEPDKNCSNQTGLTLWICLLGLLVVVLIEFLRFFLCSGKLCVCCCRSVSGDPWSKVTENAALQYSSVKYKKKPHPPAQSSPRLPEDVPDRVIYSSVISHQNQLDHMVNKGERKCNR